MLEDKALLWRSKHGSSSAFSRLYKKLFPQIDLVIIDRALELNGTESRYSLQECQASRHFNVDLNKEGIGPEWGNPPLGTFDYVIFCWKRD